MKSLIVIAAAAIVAGCAGAYNPAYYFNYVEVANLSGGSIRDLSLRVNGTPKTLACERVAANSICYDYFGRRRYAQQGIELSWVHTDGSARSETLATRVPAYFGTGLPLQVFLEIGQDGSVRVYYRQVERIESALPSFPA